MMKFDFLKRKFFSLTVLAVLFPSVLIGQAYTLQNDDVEVDANGYIISCSYDFSNKEIIIPQTLDGKTVTGIGDDVFSEKGILAVELPSTLTYIGDGAFLSNSISNIRIPDGVKKIEGNAFDENECTQLSIPESVDSIGEFAFSGNKITSVTLSSSIKYIGGGAFNGNLITSINGEESNGLFYGRTSTNTVDETTIVSYGGVVKDVNFIPDEVISISNYAFAYCGLTSVNIPENVTYIGLMAFSVNKLTSVEIPVGVTEIFSETFNHNQLSSVVFKGNVTFIGSGAFMTNKLGELNLPNAVEIIGDNAFGSNEITNLTIPDNVVIIETYAFSGNKISELNFNSTSKLKVIGNSAFYNNLLSTISIPQGVTSIGYNAFSSNSSLNSFNLPSPTGVTYTQWIDDVKTSYNFGEQVTDLEKHYYIDYSYTLTCDDVEIDANGIIQKYKCKGATDLTIPETLCGITVTGIANKEEYQNGVFSNCGLVKVLIPTLVKTIGGFTFDENYLSEVSLSNQITFIGEEAFSSNQGLIITLPTPVKEGYTFKHWKETWEGVNFNGGDMLKYDDGDLEGEYVAIFTKDTSTDVDEAKLGNSVFKVYPNPTSDIIWIEGESIEHGEATLYDISGRMIMRQKLQSNRSLVDMANLKRGVYLLEVVSGNTKEMTKIKKM